MAEGCRPIRPIESATRVAAPGAVRSKKPVYATRVSRDARRSWNPRRENACMRQSLSQKSQEVVGDLEVGAARLRRDRERRLLFLRAGLESAVERGGLADEEDGRLGAGSEAAPARPGVRLEKGHGYAAHRRSQGVPGHRGVGGKAEDRAE